MMRLAEAQRILIVRLGAMGDVINTLHAAALLRQILPAAQICWAIEPSWAPLLAGNPAIDRVAPVALSRWRRAWNRPASWAEARETIRRLRQTRFDLAIDFQGLLKSAFLGRWSGAAALAGFEKRLLREPAAAIFYHRTASANRRHVVDRNLALVRGLLSAPAASAEFPLPEGRVSPKLPREPFLLASPVAGWKAKQWPAERYAELAEIAWRERRLPLVLDCAPSGEATCVRIAAAAPQGACRVHVSSLPELIGATRRAAAVIGVDSGPLHLAAAIGTPGVALFGPTDPARNGPYGSSVSVLRHESAHTSYKREGCYSKSMRALTVERVWESVCDKLNAGPRLEIVVKEARG